MGATREQLRTWFGHGCDQGARYMIVAVDEWDHSDYPVYVFDGHNVGVVERIRLIGEQSMQRVMEVYDLTQDPEPQLALGRCWNIGAPA